MSLRVMEWREPPAGSGRAERFDKIEGDSGLSRRAQAMNLRCS